MGPSIPRQEAMKQAGQTIPAMKRGFFLVDTGASCTCIDNNLMAGLGITPTGATNIQTPSTNGGAHVCNLYDVMLYIPNQSSGGHLIEAMPIVEAGLSSQGIDGLIGRDVLNGCTLIYNGTAQLLTLAY